MGEEEAHLSVMAPSWNAKKKWIGCWGRWPRKYTLMYLKEEISHAKPTGPATRMTAALKRLVLVAEHASNTTIDAEVEASPASVPGIGRLGFILPGLDSSHHLVILCVNTVRSCLK
ncbi:hypothetical protein COCNU_scaffold008407G000010 [Cocos nucifera]|nr:hypothetical protein [Cocos nucifera]